MLHLDEKKHAQDKIDDPFRCNSYPFHAWPTLNPPFFLNPILLVATLTNKDTTLSLPLSFVYRNFVPFQPFINSALRVSPPPPTFTTMSISSLGAINATTPSKSKNATTTYLSHDGTSIITIGNSTTIIRPNIDTQNLTEIKVDRESETSQRIARLPLTDNLLQQVGILLPFTQTEDNFTHEIVWG